MSAVPFHRLVQATPSGCWEWRGHRTNGGYGVIAWNGRKRRAHRIAYEVTNGPIPAGAIICHSCDNPSCCNPAHLWLGDQFSNMRDAAAKLRLRGQRRTHCPKGHAYTEDNTYRRPGSLGRTCRACALESSKSRYAEIKGRSEQPNKRSGSNK